MNQSRCHRFFGPEGKTRNILLRVIGHYAHSTYTYCTNIRKLRELRNLSRQFVADEIGVSLKTLSNIENGVSIPDIITIDKVAKIVGVTIETLLSFDEITLLNRQEGVDGRAGSQPGKCTTIDSLRELYERLLQEKDSKIMLLEKINSLLVNSARRADEVAGQNIRDEEL